MNATDEQLSFKLFVSEKDFQAITAYNIMFCISVCDILQLFCQIITAVFVFFQSTFMPIINKVSSTLLHKAFLYSWQKLKNSNFSYDICEKKKRSYQKCEICSDNWFLDDALACWIFKPWKYTINIYEESSQRFLGKKKSGQSKSCTAGRQYFC